MTAVIYTYPPDYLMAGISAKVLAAQGVRVILAIDRADPYFACEFAEIVRTDFDRRGNLNGRDFILGHLELMRRHASGAYTIKLDSDTLVLDAERWIATHDEVALGIWVDGMQGMQGCCYALRTDALPAMIESAAALDPDIPHMEDKTVGELAAALGPVHLPVWQQDETLYATHKAGKPPAWHRERAAVLVFQLRDDDRPALAKSMKLFL